MAEFWRSKTQKHAVIHLTNCGSLECVQKCGKSIISIVFTFD